MDRLLRSCIEFALNQSQLSGLLIGELSRLSEKGRKGCPPGPA
ncbi:hypothetical protein [Streptomyces sp. RKAG290]|nr:hypothetical protein [Streptomyces sp. RKAG290]